jgi:hypothetical protein
MVDSLKGMKDDVSREMGEEVDLLKNFVKDLTEKAQAKNMTL